MIAVFLAAWLAGDPSLTPEERAAAAKAESDGFAALQSHRDCDAGAAFSRAFAIAHDQRLLLNAGLAFERAGDAQAARDAFAAIDEPAIVARAAARIKALDDAPPAAPHQCTRPSLGAHEALDEPEVHRVAEAYIRAPDVEGPIPTGWRAPGDPRALASTPHGDPAAATGDPSSSSAPMSSGTMVGIGALIAGGVIGGGTVAGMLVQHGVLFDPDSSGAGKQSAIDASPILVVSGAVAGLLVAGGAVLAWFGAGA